MCEQASPHPVSAYGRSKLAAEQAVQRLAGDLPWTILRPSAVYGPRERDLFDYFRMIGLGIFPVAGSFDSRVNLVSWIDAVDAILLAAEHPAAVRNVFHIGDARDYTTREVGDTIAQVMGKHPIRIRLPRRMVTGAAAVTEALGRAFRVPVFLTKEKANELLQLAWTCSIARAHAMIGYQPQITLPDGFAVTYRWNRNEGLL